MQPTFDLAHAFTAKWEGGLVDNPADPGGITGYGVSLRFLQDYAQKKQDNRDFLHRIGVRLPVTPSAIRSLNRDHARAIFRRAFWDVLTLDDFPRLPAIAQYDCAVNAGIRQSVLLLQRALGVADDGILGPQTREAAKGADEAELAKLLCIFRKNFYADLVRSKPELSTFLRGWNNRVNDLMEYLEAS